MITQTFYRQNSYHPIYSLRSVIGLAIQVPFFIAAFNFLSNLEALKWRPYYFIHDLSKPDALLSIGGLSINILPILMTVINLVSLFVYSKKLTRKETIQLVVMALLFLFILYNSPAALVLYWTFNNICSLIKNIIYLKPNPLKYFRYLMLSIFSFIFIYSFLLYIPFFRDILGEEKLVITERMMNKHHIRAGVIILLIFLSPKIGLFIDRNMSKVFKNIWLFPKDKVKVFYLSIISISLTIGLVIPTSLISSDPTPYFSFLTNEDSLIDLFKSVAFQSFAYFIFFPSVIYSLFKEKVRDYFVFITIFTIISVLINVYIFTGDYGLITSDLIFESNSFINNYYLENPNLLVLILTVPLLYIVILKSGVKVIKPALIITLLTLITMIVLNFIKINSSYNNYLKVVDVDKMSSNQIEKIYNLSKTKQNVLLIMLDKAVPSYFGEILTFEKGVKEIYDGFTWYPNAISSARFTLLAVPSLFGGYEYTPTEINKRDNLALVDKHNEALLVLPLIFKEKGYQTMFTDPSLANYNNNSDISIFKKYQSPAEHVMGRYSRKLISQYYKSDKVFSTQKDMIRFSIFRAAPLINRHAMYDYNRGRWNTVNNESKAPTRKEFIYSYSALEYLTKLFNYNSDENQFIAIVNETPHQAAMLFPPEYRPNINVNTNMEASFDSELLKYVEIEHYAVNAASIMRVGELLEEMRKNGVYDNTKIIIVSDHGSPVKTRFFANSKYPTIYSKYNPLVLVKDFNERGELKISNEFISNVDVPYIATSHLNDVVNPFTKKPIIKNSKSDGFKVLTSSLWRVTSQSKYIFKYTDDEIIKVKDNIFDEKNWEGNIK